MIKMIIIAVMALIVYMQLRKSANTLPEEEEIDYFPLTGAFFVTIFCILIVAIGVALSDKVAEPIQYALGGTAQQVNEYSLRSQLGKHVKLILLSIPCLFIVAYTLFRYLGDGFIDYGFWTLPRKNSRY